MHLKYKKLMEISKKITVLILSAFICFLTFSENALAQSVNLPKCTASGVWHNCVGTFWLKQDKIVGIYQNSKLNGSAHIYRSDGSVDEVLMKNNIAVLYLSMRKNLNSPKMSALDWFFSNAPKFLKQNQLKLSKLGFYRGSVDGICGKKTKKALKKYNEMFLGGADLRDLQNVLNLQSSLWGAPIGQKSALDIYENPLLSTHSRNSNQSRGQSSKNSNEDLMVFFIVVFICGLVGLFIYKIDSSKTEKKSLGDAALKGSKDQQTSRGSSGMGFGKFIARKGAIGSTARWAASCFMDYFRNYSVGNFKTDEELRREIDKIVYHALKIRFPGDLQHVDAQKILSEYVNWRHYGYWGFVNSVLIVEAGLHQNSQENISMFGEIIEEELEKANVGPVIIYGHVGARCRH